MLHQNFSPEQRHVQRLVDQFNADEEAWERLETTRRLLRMRYPHLSRRRRDLLYLVEVILARPIEDCVGFLKS